VPYSRLLKATYSSTDARMSLAHTGSAHW
jgi:hypothetical protein